MKAPAGAKRPILYLDVDGVLLGSVEPEPPGCVPTGVGVALAPHAGEFLSYCTTHFDCYWLTSHCHDGESGSLMRYLARFAGEEVLALAAVVIPTAWRTLKTEAIDPDSDFYVIDDGLLQVEQRWLAARDVLDRWIQADTRKRPQDLRRALEMLEEKLTTEPPGR